MYRVQPLGSPLDGGHLWNQQQRGLRSKSAFQRALLAETQDDGKGVPSMALVPVAPLAATGLPARPGTTPPTERSRRQASAQYRVRRSATGPILLDIVV
jgi:hypothetical protein